MTSAGRPRLTSCAGVVWWAVVLLGCPLIGYAIVRTGEAGSVPNPHSLILIAALTILLELFPLSLGNRRFARGVVLSTAFAYAVMFVWGPWVAIATQVVGTGIADARAHKQWFKIAFNLSHNAITISAMAAVVRPVSPDVSPTHPLVTFDAHHVPLMALSWLVGIAINAVLVGTVLGGLVGHVARAPREFVQDVSLSLGVYGMAPLVVDLALGNWYLAPLLVTPMLLLHHTGRIAESREYAAGHDPLTGLANRLTFTTAVDAAITSQLRHGEQFAVVLIDLDGFKGVNDTLGHHAGDAVLVEFAQRLRSSVRPDDCVARLGGDEFALVVRRVDKAGADAVAGQLAVLDAVPVTVDAVDVPIRFSVGMARCPDDGANAAALLRAADTAMYEVKQHRRTAAGDRPRTPDGLLAQHHRVHRPRAVRS